LATQPDYVAGKLLRDLVQSVEAEPPEKENSFGAIRYGPRRTEALRNECLKIADRLLQSAPVADIAVITVLSQREEFERLASGVMDCIRKNDPESGLDRLHTFTTAMSAYAAWTPAKSHCRVFLLALFLVGLATYSVVIQFLK
jgi:hypothetical protein